MALGNVAHVLRSVQSAFARPRPPRSGNDAAGANRPRMGKDLGIANAPNTPKAQAIIDKAMTDPEVYKAMAAREGKVWSSALTEPETLKARQLDQAAARELGLNRDNIILRTVLDENGLKPEKGLSLGCGAGRAEREFIAQGICKSFHGIDIAADAIADAERLASEGGLPLTYEVQDLNFLELPAAAFDLVVAQTSLHHVLHLERVADQIDRTLKPGGVFWLHDYVGETQFQFSDERIAIVNGLIDRLPEKLRQSTVAKAPVGRLQRREPGTLISPFESIRSGEIREVFLSRFDVVAARERSAFLHRVMPVGTRANYQASEDTKTIFELLLYIDDLLIEKEIVEPAEGQYLLKKR